MAGIVLLLLGLATLWLAVRGPQTRSREGTEVGLAGMLPEPAWRALFGLAGVALIALAIASLL